MERIDLKKLDPDFKHRVAQELGGEHIRTCYSCGVCSARCPIEKIEPEYNPRKIIRMILLGMEEALLKGGIPLALFDLLYLPGKLSPGG